MKLVIPKAVLILLATHVIGVFLQMECDGGPVDKLPDGCEAITLRALKITKDMDEKTLEEKLQKVKRILAGLEVIRTDLTEINFPQVYEIAGGQDRSLVFIGNSKLERIKFPMLNGSAGVKLVFTEDHFPTAAYEKVDSYSDLLKMAKIFQPGDGCSDSFIEITVPEDGGLGTAFYVLLILVVISSIVLVVLGVMFGLNYSKRKKANSDTMKEKGKEGKDAKEGGDDKKKNKKKDSKEGAEQKDKSKNKSKEK